MWEESELYTSPVNAETAREFLLALPHVAETQQWGDNLVFWVGDKVVGGRMFCLIDLAGGVRGSVVQGAASFAVGAERFAELVERNGLKPAPYLARAHWVAAERWTVLRHSEWEELLRSAHALVFAKLAKGTRTVLALPARERAGILRERRELLASKVPEKRAGKSK